MSKIRLLIVFLLCSLVLGAQEMSVAERNAAQGFNDTIDRLDPDFVKVSLVVAEPSEVLYSTLGHAALHLQCPIFDLDYVFSYESEDVRDKIWTFLKGDLKMGMLAMPVDTFLLPYEMNGRGVREYTINLSPEEEQRLWEIMDKHVAEGTNLPYDYFHRGCAKSVVRVIHEALGRDAVHYAPWPDKYTQHTMRELGCMFVGNSAPWNVFFSYFLIGTKADKKMRPEHKLIVPTDLVEVWQHASFDNGKPVLDSESRVLLESTQHNAGTWCTPLLVSLLMLLLAFVPWKGADYMVLAVEAMAGAVMTYLIVFSKLPCTDWNWLIIPFNILPVLAWKWRQYWALPYAGIVLVWCVVMSGEWIWGHILVDWSHIVLALAFCVILVKNSPKFSGKNL